MPYVTGLFIGHRDLEEGNNATAPTPSSVSDVSSVLNILHNGKQCGHQTNLTSGGKISVKNMPPVCRVCGRKSYRISGGKPLGIMPLVQYLEKERNTVNGYDEDRL
jgi:hypothetical protein